MPFVLERLADDQREQAGFARTGDDVRGKGNMKFARTWAIDRERERCS